jgi:hypothetical protein
LGAVFIASLFLLFWLFSSPVASSIAAVPCYRITQAAAPR